MNKFKAIVIALVGSSLALGTGLGALSLLTPSSSSSGEGDQAVAPEAPPTQELSGTVGYGGRQVVRLAPADSAVVTRPPEAGALLEEGSLALEVSGRPVRVLEGAVPMYRELRMGMKGDDVRQFEVALARLGFQPGAADGVFDARTAAAVDAWYASAGSASQGPSDEDRERLRSLQAEADSADDERLEAQEALEMLRRGVEPEDLVDAEIDVHDAAQGVEEAREAGEDPGDREITLHEAKSAVEEAKSLWNDAKAAETEARAAEQAAAASLDRAAVDGAAEEADAAAELTESENELMHLEDRRRIAESQLRRAEQERDEAKSKSDKKELDDEIEELRAELYEAVGEAGRARATVEARAQRLESVRAATLAAKQEAESNRQAARATTQRAASAVSVAERAIKVAEEGLRLATVGSERDVRVTERALRSAEEGLRLARLKLEALRRPADTAAAEQQAARAARRAEAAERELTEFSGNVKVVVPAHEVLFLPSLPVRVDEVLVERAAAADGEVMAVTGVNLTVDVAVDSEVAQSVKLPSPVAFWSSDLGVEGTGRAVALQRTSDDDDEEEFRVVVALIGAPPELLGKEINVTLLQGE